MLTSRLPKKHPGTRSIRPPRVSFDLASEGDDAELRALQRRTPMRGAIDLAFLREPSYFRGTRMLGTEVQTIVARCDGRIIGVGTRALRLMRVNGTPTPAGYLTDLRLLPEHRGGTIVARGYRFLRGLHDDGRANLYTTVIVADNQLALSTIAAGRAGLPHYVDQGRVLTPMLRVGRPRPDLGGDIVCGSPALLPAIVDKLNATSMQFSLLYSVEDFGPGGRFADFRVEDFRVLRRGVRIAGVMASWDQRPHRQAVALGYHGWLRGLSPILRPFMGAFGTRPLPAPGVPLAQRTIAFVATDDTDAYRLLLRRIYRETRDASHLVVGLHERDPRVETFSEYSRAPFAGRLFTVTFDEPVELDGRVPSIETSLI